MTHCYISKHKILLIKREIFDIDTISNKSIYVYDISVVLAKNNLALRIHIKCSLRRRMFMYLFMQLRYDNVKTPMLERFPAVWIFLCYR